MYAAMVLSEMALTKPTTCPVSVSIASQKWLLFLRIFKCVSGDGGFGQPTKKPAKS